MSPLLPTRLFLLTVLVGLLAPLSGQSQTLELGLPLGHRERITALTTLPDGTLISTSGRNILYHWDLEERRLLKRHFVEFGFNINQVTADGLLVELRHRDRFVARAGSRSAGKNTAIIFDPATDTEQLGRLPDAAITEFIKVSRDGKYFLNKGTLTPFSSAEGARKRKLSAQDLAFYAGGSVIGPFNFRVERPEYWSYPELEPIEIASSAEWPRENGFKSSLKTGDFWVSKVTNNGRQEMAVYSALNGRIAGRLTLPAEAHLITYNEPTNSALAWFSGADRHAELRRIPLGAPGEGTVFPAPPHPDEKYGTPLIEEAMRSFNAQPIFSRDGKLVIQSNTRGGLYLYDALTGQMVDSLVSHVHGIKQLRLAPNGTGLLVSAFDHKESALMSWDWQQDNVLRSPDQQVKPAAFRDDFFRNRTAAPAPALGVNDGDSVLEALQRMRALPPGSPDGSARISYRCELPDGFAQAEPNQCYFVIVRTQPDGAQERQVVDTHLEDPLADGYFSSYAVYQDKQLAVGTKGGFLLIFDLAGNLLAGKQLHDGSLNDIVFTADGSRLLTGGDDGGINILDATSLERLASLYWMGQQDWVVIGRDNRFDASTRAMTKLYYKLRDDAGQVEIVELDQMKDRFYDPGLLQKILGLTSVPKRNTAQLDQVRLYPEARMAITDDRLTVRLRPRAGGIGRIALFLNDKELEEDVNPGRDTSFSVDLNRYKRFFLQDNVLSLHLYNSEETLRSAPEEIEYVYAGAVRARGEKTTTRASGLNKEDYLRAKLFVIAIGSSDYTEGSGKSLDLSFPDRDAEAMSLALKSSGCELFCTQGEVDVTCLTTDARAPATLAPEGIAWAVSTKANVEQAIRSLKEKAQPQDIVVIYFSGHGKTYNSNGKEQFHYLTREVSPDNVGNAAAIANAVISSEELTALLKEVPAGKQVLVFDACNSGQAIDDLTGASKNLNSSQILALTRMSDRTGLYLLTGSAADQLSYEANRYGQGLLTYALLKGMGGAALTADENRTFLVGVTELFEYAQREVVDLARSVNGIQKPQINYPRRAGSFPLGIVNEKVKSLIGKERKMLTPPIFIDTASLTDNIQLEAFLTKLLLEESQAGPDAVYGYTRQQGLPGAYAIRGLYGRNPATGEYTLRASLSRAGETPIPLRTEDGSPLSGSTPEELAEALEAAIFQSLE